MKHSRSPLNGSQELWFCADAEPLQPVVGADIIVRETETEIEAEQNDTPEPPVAAVVVNEDAALLLSRLEALEPLLRARAEGTIKVRVYEDDAVGAPMVDAAAGPPALALAASLGLTPFELDVLCLVVGAHIDLDVRALLVRAGARRGQVTESFALAALLPSLDWRLAQRGSLSDRGRLVSAGLLHPRGTSDPSAPFLPTRRAIAMLEGRHLLDDLPLFARVATAEPRFVEIDVARARRALGADAATRLVGELIRDAQICEFPVALVNTDSADDVLAPLAAVIAECGATVVCPDELVDGDEPAGHPAH